MANSITGRQWFVDTPGPDLIWTGNIKIVDIEFTQYAADGDNFVILDNNGRVVWEGNGNADLSPVRSGRVGWADGLRVTVLTDGVLLIHVE